MLKPFFIFIVSGLVTIFSLVVMLAIPIRDLQEAPCCDAFDLEASYGFPMPFKQDYSGGISGRGDVEIKPVNVVIDGTFVFVTTALILTAASAFRKR